MISARHIRETKLRCCAIRGDFRFSWWSEWSRWF